MIANKLRGLIAMTLALTLLAGAAARCIEYQTAVAAEFAATTAADHGSMPNGCDGCNKQAKFSDACVPLCAGMPGLMPVGSAVLEMPLLVLVQPFVRLEMADHSDPPDPYPPRTIVLS